jgi:hypothetical protein
MTCYILRWRGCLRGALIEDEQENEDENELRPALPYAFISVICLVAMPMGLSRGTPAQESMVVRRSP